MKKYQMLILVSALFAFQTLANGDCPDGYKKYNTNNKLGPICSLDPSGKLVDLEFFENYSNKTQYIEQLTHNQEILHYALVLSIDKNTTNTKCYGGETGPGVCWDLAACAISKTYNKAVWGCWNGQQHGTSGPYYDPCYQWGTEIKDKNYWQAVITKENLAEENFIVAGVLPGDILQVKAYTQYCDGKKSITTGEGHHTAIITEVYENYLTVCQQNMNHNTNDVCGYEFFKCPGSGDKVSTTIENARADYVRIYRPDGTQVSVPESACDACVNIRL